jgi:hypothetical protein
MPEILVDLRQTLHTPLPQSLHPHPHPASGTALSPLTVQNNEKGD